MKRRCAWNVHRGGSWRRCSKGAMAVMRMKELDVYDFGLTVRRALMTWYQCTECEEWLPAFGNANSAPVYVEIRAADIAQRIHEGALWRADESSAGNGGELAGWITYTADSLAGALEPDEAAGYLAAAIWRHDTEQALESV